MIVDYSWVLVVLASTGFTGWFALNAGLDANWDLLNYHYWSVYALFEGRVFFDIAPAQVQTWLNPLVYVPAYLAIESLTPAIATFVMAVVAGLNGLLLYRLAIELVDVQFRLRYWFLIVSIIAIGLTGPIFLSQVGTSFADPLCSLLILGGILLIYSRQGAQIFFGGLALGAAVGLKLTTAPFAVAAFVALLVISRDWGLSARGLAAFVAGGIIGAGMTGGYWALYLYFKTGNPVFPFYNSVFQSSLYSLENFSDNRFRPVSITNALFYPLQLYLGQHPTAEVPFRDPRFLVVNGLLSIYIVKRIYARIAGSGSDVDRSPNLRFFLTFFLVSYIIWLTLWGIQRYATTLELLSGVLIFLLVNHIVPKQPAKVLVTSVLALLIVAMTTPANWGRVTFGEKHFVHHVKYPESYEANTLYLIVGEGEPLAYTLPAIARRARFVRLTGNHGAQTEDMRLGQVIARIINQHLGPLRTLSVVSPGAKDRSVLMSYGLALEEPVNCDLFEASPLTKLTACVVKRESIAARTTGARHLEAL